MGRPAGPSARLMGCPGRLPTQQRAGRRRPSLDERSVDIPVLIVGGGGAGLTASMLLSQLGVGSLVVSALPTTSVRPKAHVLNQRSGAKAAWRYAGLRIAGKTRQATSSGARVHGDVVTVLTILRPVLDARGQRCGAALTAGKSAMGTRVVLGSPCA